MYKNKRITLNACIKKNIRLIAVDLQYDFTREGGKHFKDTRESPLFIRETLLPFLQQKGMKVAEIISDYRQPRPGDNDESCVPGTVGYTSEIPEDVVRDWFVKSQNSPLYTREDAGVPEATGLEEPKNVGNFEHWIAEGLNFSPDKDVIVLFGLTLDCCVLCTAQAFRFMGFNVKVLMEATDTYKGGEESKMVVMNEVVNNWADPIFWEELKKLEL